MDKKLVTLRWAVIVALLGRAAAPTTDNKSVIDSRRVDNESEIFEDMAACKD